MESTPAEEAEGQAIVGVLAVVLERLVSANSHLASAPGGRRQREDTKFHALRAPAIGILQYLERIHKYASCSKECFILALVYVDRLIQRDDFLLTSLNVHRVVITAVLLAAKFFDDAYYNNAYYAKVGGVLVQEMNALECEFLFRIDFGLRVAPEVFDKYRDELIGHATAMGLNRIENCTDEDLLMKVSERQQAVQQQQQQQHQVQAMMASCQHHQQQQQHQQQQLLNNAVQVVPPQAPVPEPSLRPYSQVEIHPTPAAYPNPASVAPVSMCHQDQPATPHYPIQALHQSMMMDQLAQQPQQQPVATVPLDPTLPFPTLAQQVSANDLSMLFHTVTTTTTPASSIAAAPQDLAPSQHTNQTLAHLGPPQAQYSQAELMNLAYVQNLTTPAAAAPHSQLANYYTEAQTAGRPSTLAQGHPEITPSPPPQPHIHIQHGAHQLPMGCGPSRHVGPMGDSTTTGASATGAYLKSRPVPSVGALHAHHDLAQRLPQANAALHHNQQLLPSRPIAITLGNEHHHHHHHHHLAQDNNTAGWPCNMFSLERTGVNQKRSPV